MQPFLRLERHENLQSLSEGEDGGKPTYQEALTKLIPAEVVGLYLGGKNAIEAYFQTATGSQESPTGFWIGWTVLCVFGLLIYRAWGTSELKAQVPPEYPAIVISLVSFLVWVYSFGDAFRILGFWHPLFSTLLVLAWTFLVPLIYQRWLNSK